MKTQFPCISNASIAEKYFKLFTMFKKGKHFCSVWNVKCSMNIEYHLSSEKF